MARTVQFLVVFWQSAKHRTATDAIRQHRPRDLPPIIYAAGKGSSSVLTDLQARLDAWTDTAPAPSS